MKLIFLVLEQYKLFLACCYLHLWWYFWYWLQKLKFIQHKVWLSLPVAGAEIEGWLKYIQEFQRAGKKSKGFVFLINNIFYEKVIKDHVSGSQLGGRRVPRGHPHWHPLRPPGKQRCQHWGGFCLRDSSKVYRPSPNRLAKAKVFFPIDWTGLQGACIHFCIWVILRCWGNSSMVEGRFSKWF